MIEQKKLIGMFPAGGRATRLGSINCSKEIIPVMAKNNKTIPVGQFLIDAYENVKVDEIIIITRKEKTDIRGHFSNTSLHKKFRYIDLQRHWGTPFTLDDAWPYTRDHIIALGFPDIILQPENVFRQLKDKMIHSQADVVLGLFTTNTPQKADMVNSSNTGRVINLEIKPSKTTLTQTWVTAICQPSFTRFMHEFLENEETLFRRNPERREPFVGTVINAAIDKGFHVDSHQVEGGKCLDIGTPDDLARAQSYWVFG